MTYRSVYREGKSDLTVTKSRFIGFVCAAADEGSAQKIVAEISAEYKDCSHVCYAYITDAAGNHRRFSDAGEPSGTAGLPILETIADLRHVVCVVVRYFGGVKLGTGGIARAYKQAAAAALSDAEIRFYMYMEKVECRMSFKEYGSLGKKYIEVRGGQGIL